MNDQHERSANTPPPEGCPQDGVVNRALWIYDTILVQNPIIHLPYNSTIKERAKAFRRTRNLPEVLFWQQVHKRKFHQIDFDRQRIIGNYIVDFYVKRLGLVIEIDGLSHNDTKEYDELRETYLFSLGLRVYRISVDDVLKHMDFVLMGLENFILEHYSG